MVLHLFYIFLIIVITSSRLSITSDGTNGLLRDGERLRNGINTSPTAIVLI